MVRRRRSGETAATESRVDRALVLASRVAELAARFSAGDADEHDVELIEALWRTFRGLGQNDDPAKRNVFLAKVEAARPEYEKSIAYSAAAKRKLDAKYAANARERRLLKELASVAASVDQVPQKRLAAAAGAHGDLELHARAVLSGYARHYPDIAQKMSGSIGLVGDVLDKWSERRGWPEAAAKLFASVGLDAAPNSIKVGWSEYRNVSSRG